MKKNFLSIALRITGIIVILIATITTIVQLTHFDVFTFNLSQSIITLFGAVFIGSFLIILSVIVKTVFFKSTNSKATEKDFLEKKPDAVKNKVNKCEYCGSAIDETSKKCPNCGANYKK